MSEPEPARAEIGVVREERQRHVYLLNAFRVPVLRLIGLALTAAAVGLHNVYVARALSPQGYLILCASLLAYGLLTWLALHLYYRRPRTDAHHDLGWTFHLADVAVIVAVVLASGGERSWLFFLLLVPIWNQTHFSAKRAAISSVLAATLYVGLLFYLREIQHRAISIQLAAFRTSSILIISAYCTLSAALAEQSRRRVTLALREARGSAERRSAHLDALNRMTQTVTSTLDLGPMLDAIAGETLTFLDASSCAITLLDRESWTLEVVACRAIRSDVPNVVGLKIPVDQNPACGKAIATQKPVIVADAQTSPLTAVTHDALRTLGVQCLMSTPILSRGEVIGTFSIHTDDPMRVFTAEEAQMATTLAGQVAAPIRNARLYSAERRSRELAERLESAGRAITQSLDLDSVLKSILDHLHEVIAYDAGSVQILEDGAMRVLAVRGHPPTEVGRVRPLTTHAYNKRLAEHPEPYILHNPVSSGEMAHDGGILDEMRTVMGLPLIVHDRIIGAMSIDSRRERAYDDHAAEAAMSFARFAAIAIEHARLYASMQELSIVDALTRVANRRHFDNVLQTEWHRALRARSWFSVVMIDVDDFKGYNDCYGHVAGDIVLQQVAGSLRTSLQRAGDVVARYGGEEFVVLLPAADAAAALQLGELLRQRVAALQIPHERSRACQAVTISVGVSSAVACDGIEPLALIETADRQLYAAKANGRNCVRGGLAFISSDANPAIPLPIEDAGS